MTEPTIKRMGRPPKISREAIVDAAARREPAELQLTALAEELGVSVKTIYYYFPARQALIDALIERAVAEMGIPNVAVARTWQEVMCAVAVWYYRIGLEQPGWFVDKYAINSTAKRVGLELLRLVCEKLAELGWAKHDAFRAHSVISTWAVAKGEWAHRAPMAQYSTDEMRLILSDYINPQAAGELSQLPHPFRSDEELFGDGLDIVLAGIEQVILGGELAFTSPRP